MRSLRTPLAAALGLCLLVACDGSGGPPADAGSEGESEDSLAVGPGRGFERALVFTASGPDERLTVPWILEAVTRPGGVDRVHRGWLLREDEWESFYRNAWSVSPRREPWRVLPDGPFRILVGEGDRLDRVVFEGSGRRLQMTLDESLVEWTDDRGGAFSLVEGALVLGDRRVPGRILDVSEGRRLAEPGLGDWLYLTSESGWSVVLKGAYDAEEESRYQMWVLGPGEEEEGPWTGVSLVWSETRTFEPARRPIPRLLELSGGEDGPSGRLEVTSLQLETRDGEGPVLPVDGLVAVSGEIRLGDRREIEVQGVMRHRRW